MPTSPENQLFQPGNVIVLADATQLQGFEDVVAAEVNPHMGPTELAAWGGRVALKDVMRPSQFNGRIIDIMLEVMPNPQAEYNFQLYHGFREPAYHDISHGFNLIANAKSSGRGIVGQVQGRLWYGPTDYSYASEGRRRTTRHTYSGGGIRRIFHGPRYEKERFISFQQQSEAIGFATLRDAMKHPFRG